MEVVHPACHAVTGEVTNPGLHERPVKAEIDLRHTSRRSKAAVVFLAIASEGANVIQGPDSETDEVIARNKIG